MSSVSKDLIREMVKEEQFGSTKEIMEAIKGMFKEVLQEAMEAELDEQLGYERYEKSEVSNRRNGHSKKTVKSEFRLVYFPNVLNNLQQRFINNGNKWIP